MVRQIVLALMLLSSAPAHAVQPDEILKDAALEQRARAISSGLRCLVCQNQSIDESDAPLARDLRVLVRERLSAGASNAEVESFVVARYGDFVLLRPPMNARTALLWGAPFLVLLAGAIGLWRLRRRDPVQPVTSLSAGEQAQVEALLKRESD